MSIAGLYTGIRALNATQIALEITGQNIANVNTPNYTRQRVSLVQTDALRRSYGSLGTGVAVDGIERVRDAFIDLEIKGQKSNVGARSVEADIYDRIEQILNEPSEIGIVSLLGDFFDALSDVANSPEDIGVRDALAIKAQTLTGQINFFDNKLDQLRLDTNATVANTVTEINSLTQQVAELNTEILKVEASNSHIANDLRDKRQGVINDLAERTNITVSEMDSGEVNISISGFNVVFGAVSRDLDVQLKTGDELPVHDVVIANTNGIVNFSSGTMAGYLQSRDTNIVNVINDLDTFARGLIDELNNIHVDGRGLNGFSNLTSVNAVDNAAIPLDTTNLAITPVDTSFDIGVYDSGSDTTTSVTIAVDVSADSLTNVAANINAALVGAGITEVTASVNANNELAFASSDTDFTFTFGNVTDDTSNFLSAIGINTFFTGSDASNIAINNTVVTNPEFIAAATSAASGDNNNALLMADLRESKNMSSNTRTIEGFYQAFVVGIGADAQNSQIDWDAHDGYLTQLLLKRESVSGVNLDEEAANLIRYQRAYEASARYISVIDQILNTLVNGLI